MYILNFMNAKNIKVSIVLVTFINFRTLILLILRKYYYHLIMFISKRIMNNCLSVVLNFTLPRHRKTEPTLLWWTKVVVSIILLSGLFVYIYVLIDLII